MPVVAGAWYASGSCGAFRMLWALGGAWYLQRIRGNAATRLAFARELRSAAACLARERLK